MNREKAFKEFDFEGEETLRAIAEADNFNEWMFQEIEGYCKGDILEIGSGIGNISNFFIKDNRNIFLSDIREQYRSYLKGQFPAHTVYDLDIVHPDFDTKYKDKFGKFDTVFALNVVEHIEDDKLATLNMIKLLKPGGKLVVLVPAYQWLYNHFDTALEHFRRYTKSKAIKMLPVNLKVLKCWYFNFAGIFGWYLVGKIAKKETIPRSNMKLYNILTPVFKLVDKILLHKAGLSVIVIAEK